MSNTFKLRSNSLISLNEELRKLTILEGAKIVKNPMLEADGKFVSVINTDSDFNHTIAKGIDVEEEENEKILEKKAGLISKVESKLKQALKNNDEINKLLKEIDHINSDTKYMEWTLNEKGNTALLKDRNAQIFKQNDNLCLSVNDNVHLFDSVRDLHDWLIKHNFPVPKGIKLTEAKEDSVNNKEDDTKKYHKDRVGKIYQPQEILQTIEKTKRLQSLMSKNGIDDTNILLSSVFKNDDRLEQEIKNKEELDNEDNQVEECTTIGDLGMQTQYLARKKEEAGLEEDWPAPASFNLVDDKGAQLKFKSIIDGTRAICLALFKDPAFALNDEKNIQMTQEEFDHWKQLASDMDYVIAFAIPAICHKKANDYVNESIEKGNKTGMDPVKFSEIVKKNVKDIFGYDLTDEELTAMLKRNSKGKGVDTTAPNVRSVQDEEIVVNAKKAMGRSKANREGVIDEIFNSMSREGRIGYAKYKKFAELMNNEGGIEIVQSHDPAVNVVPQYKQPTDKTIKSPADVIYSALLSGNKNKAQEIIKTLDPNTKETVKTELITKNPNIEKFITPMFEESVEENSLGKAFLKSINA